MTFSGQLLSSDYLQREPPPVRPTAAASERFSALRREAARVLGPALAPRAVAAGVALPLVRWLGWPAPSCEKSSGHFCAFQLVASGTEPVLLVATAVGGVNRPLRQAVSLALAGGGRWLLVTDGRLLRIADVLRGDPRGVVDIALDACRDDGIALGWLVSLAGPAAFVTRGARSLAALANESEAHGRRVCAALKEGVADALDMLTAAVAAAGGAYRGVDACYADARIAAYRMLFLLFAEARQLVPLWHPTYRRGYSVDTLGMRVASGASPRGTWAALQAIARLAHAGADAGDFRVVAFNGRLFSPARAPLLDHLTLDDQRVARALTSLCFAAANRQGRQRIAYRDLGVEQLGSVYESLLDRGPSAPAKHGPSRTARPITSTRKTTGTFYTPSALAYALVRETLEPLVAGKNADEILSLRVLDPAMGSGAFLVSAGRYLAERWEAAIVESGEVRAEDLSDSDRAATRRRIASRCLFGVDRNPMAVQLAQLSMWLATLAPDRPLSFLDHHLVCGNSLIGAGPLDVLERPPGRATRGHALPLESLFDWSASLVSVRDGRAGIEAAVDDTASAVRRKEHALAALGDDPGLGRWKRACDLWCAAWIRGVPSNGVYHAWLDRVLGRAAGMPSLDNAAEALIAGARALGCFHWPLEFPEVFLDADGRPSSDGGFDAVVGNPPWEMLRHDSNRIRNVREETTDTVRFARASGTYRSQGRGHANQVQLFVERAVGLARPGGRVGLIVPSTLLTDEGSAPLRRSLILANGLDTVSVYENRRAIFPIHRSVRFATVLVTRFGQTSSVACRFGLTEVPPEHGPAATAVRLTPALLEHMSGPGLAVPDLPTPADVALVEGITRLHRPLAHPDGWHVTFGRELNASDDRDVFRDPGVAAGWPVIEGRHLSPFRVDLAGTTRIADPSAARARLGSKAAIARPRLAYRDVASATNRTTLIAAIVPADVVTVHTVFCLREGLPLAEQRVLCALMNSYVANYLVRRRVTTHVTTAIVSALPVPVVTRLSPYFAVLDEAATRLARAADAEVAAETQAVIAEIYGLTLQEFDHILATFPLVPLAERAAASERFRARTRPRSFR